MGIALLASALYVTPVIGTTLGAFVAEVNASIDINDLAHGLTKTLIFAVLITGFLLSAPWYLLRRMAERHRQRIEDQLAGAMVTLSNAVKAGLSLSQSLEILAAQCPKPINGEFHQIVAEYKMGKTLERTLVEAKERLRSENFALFAAALLASHDSGGRLNETVERIAEDFYSRAMPRTGPRRAVALLHALVRTSQFL